MDRWLDRQAFSSGTCDGFVAGERERKRFGGVEVGSSQGRHSTVLRSRQGVVGTEESGQVVLSI